MEDGRILKLMKKCEGKVVKCTRLLPSPRMENRYLVTFFNKEQEYYTTTEFKTRFGFSPHSFSYNKDVEEDRLLEKQIKNIEKLQSNKRKKLIELKKKLRKTYLNTIP